MAGLSMAGSGIGAGGGTSGSGFGSDGTRVQKVSAYSPSAGGQSSAHGGSSVVNVQRLASVDSTEVIN